MKSVYNPPLPEKEKQRLQNLRSELLKASPAEVERRIQQAALPEVKAMLKEVILILQTMQHARN